MKILFPSILIFLFTNPIIAQDSTLVSLPDCEIIYVSSTLMSENSSTGSLEVISPRTKPDVEAEPVGGLATYNQTIKDYVTNNGLPNGYNPEIRNIIIAQILVDKNGSATLNELLAPTLPVEENKEYFTNLVSTIQFSPAKVNETPVCQLTGGLPLRF